MSTLAKTPSDAGTALGTSYNRMVRFRARRMDGSYRIAGLSSPEFPINFEYPACPCKLTPAGLEGAKILLAGVCAGMRDYPQPGRHAELGRRLSEILGEIHTDDWPALFGRGGITGPSYLATEYSAARLERTG
jgi:hypothetical protein